MSEKTIPPNPEGTVLFRELEHTGDVGIEVSAPSRGELFRGAALALASLLVDTANVQALEPRTVALAAAGDADLMHDLLTELLDLFIVESFIWRDASIEETEGGLRVTVRGERFEGARHAFLSEIKGITYHQLTVEKTSQGWWARVIFDV